MVKQDTSINEEELYWICNLYCWLVETVFFGEICIKQMGGF